MKCVNEIWGKSNYSWALRLKGEKENEEWKESKRKQKILPAELISNAGGGTQHNEIPFGFALPSLYTLCNPSILFSRIALSIPLSFSSF